MLGIRFYLEYQTKKDKSKATRKSLGNHLGSVVAVLHECSFIADRYVKDKNICVWKLCSLAKKRIPIEGKITCPECGNGLSPYKELVLCFDAISGLIIGPNPSICGTTVSQDYLDNRCKRISEQTARQIHPRLFERLDGS